MNNTSRHLEGVADKVVGGVKKNVGKLIDNEQMQAEGAARQMAGQAQIEAVKGSERVQGKVEEVTGAIKRKAGELIDNEQMQIEGAARQAKGNARQALNK